MTIVASIGESPARVVEDFLDHAFGEHPDRPDDETEFDRTGWDRVRASGLLGAPFSPEVGGLGLSLTESLAPLERLGYLNPDAGLSFAAMTTMASTAVALSRFGTDQQRHGLPAGGCLRRSHRSACNHGNRDRL